MVWTLLICTHLGSMRILGYIDSRHRDEQTEIERQERKGGKEG